MHPRVRQSRFSAVTVANQATGLQCLDLYSGELPFNINLPGFIFPRNAFAVAGGSHTRTLTTNLKEQK